jgi:hypothetical protein
MQNVRMQLEEQKDTGMYELHVYVDDLKGEPFHRKFVLTKFEADTVKFAAIRANLKPSERTSFSVRDVGMWLSVQIWKYDDDDELRCNLCMLRWHHDMYKHPDYDGGQFGTMQCFRQIVVLDARLEEIVYDVD